MKNNLQRFKNDLEECLIESKFKSLNHVMLHIKLKNLRKNYKISYDQLTSKILEVFDLTNPKNIIVPSFTYSFTKNKAFELDKSRSEVGKFSEIFRLKYSRYRTNDPIFSFCHKYKCQSNYKDINFNCAFTYNSIWEYFYNEDIVVVNMGLEHLVISLIHYIEFICKVPYRRLIQINGKVLSKEKEKVLVYDFYAREKNSIYALDWIKIEKDLINNKIFKIYFEKKLNFKWFKIKKLSNFLKIKIKEDPYYLVKKVASD